MRHRQKERWKLSLPVQPVSSSIGFQEPPRQLPRTGEPMRALVKQKRLECRWMGSQDDLKVLLMKAVNRKNPETGRYAITQNALSFLGRRYVSPGLLQRLRGKEIAIYYDRRDISVIYLVLEGELVGEALCTEFMGRRVSVWEANAEPTSGCRPEKRSQSGELRKPTAYSGTSHCRSPRPLARKKTLRAATPL